MAAAAEESRDAIHLMGQRLFARFTARDHQRNARFIDEDRIGFIDHRGCERPMDLLARIERQAVAQMIEPNLVGGGIGDVARVGPASLFQIHALLDMAYRESQEFIDPAHPLGVAARQIIVHRHHVNARACSRVPNHGRNRGQRFAFAGLHFGDLSGGESQRALELDVEHLQTEHAFGNHGGERSRQGDPARANR